ncbi:MAG: hypothetical protein GXX81_10275 [Acidobacteria bacterium]|jgi:CRISPR-associated protein Cmr1|nr:hypothetical protein [Acidobacteriota bacterium]
MKMQQLEYEVHFLTPAFLGNAKQSAQWRTPPFKALLRQWWRVAYAAEKRFTVRIEEMRREEGMLFGNAWLSHKEGNKEVHDYCKSLVRVRLLDDAQSVDSWALGTQQGVTPLSTRLETSYAWFGLIKRGGNLGDRWAIKPMAAESVRKLLLAFEDIHLKRMKEVVALMHAFGLLGSRSRGGWGALHIEGAELLAAEDLFHYARDVSKCLEDDWAMSLAKDDKGLLIWEGTENFNTWDKAMHFVAITRKSVRTALKNGGNLRPALGFASPGRMPSPLRWKVVKGDQGGLRVRVFAMPHGIPEKAGIRLSTEQLSRAWRIVAGTLDGVDTFRRLG